MKKLFKMQNSPIIVCIIAIVLMAAVLIFLIAMFSSASANLGKQQQWTSGKDSFDRAYEIAALDKDTPDKTLYVPNLCEQIGKTVDQACQNIGQGATVVSTSSSINDYNSGAISETHINLNNESGNEKSGTPNIIAYTNRSGRIVKISFSCNVWLLGYGNYSYIDMVNNFHIIEKTLNEAGLSVDEGSVKTPENRELYTTYDSDGTTTIMQNWTFSGSSFKNGKTYSWSSNLVFDYSIANSKGDLSETIRTITIAIQ